MVGAPGNAIKNVSNDNYFIVPPTCSAPKNRTCFTFLKVKAGKNLIGGEKCDEMDDLCLKLTNSKSRQYIWRNYNISVNCLSMVIKECNPRMFIYLVKQPGSEFLYQVKEEIEQGRSPGEKLA